MWFFTDHNPKSGSTIPLHVITKTNKQDLAYSPLLRNQILLSLLLFALEVRSGLRTLGGVLTAGSSVRMSGMMANLDGGVLVYGELRISSKNFRSYMIRVPRQK